MGKTYSLDLREKVITFISQSGEKRAAARIFNLGEDTIYRWLRLARAGSLAPKKRVDFFQKVPDALLQDYVEKHPDDTLEEIGRVLGLHSSKVWKHLKRLSITRKKRHCNTRKVALSNEKRTKQP